MKASSVAKMGRQTKQKHGKRKRKHNREETEWRVKKCITHVEPERTECENRKRKKVWNGKRTK